MRIIDQLAEHVLSTRFDQFDDDTIEAARLRLIDTMSCAVGGAGQPGNAAMLDLVRSWGGTAQATILAHGDRVPLHHAAMMNSLQCRSFDFEVTGPEAEGINAGKMVGHVCSTTEPAAWSVAEFTRASGRDLLAAVIIGGDIGARMAVAGDFDFRRCFEVCGTANTFGATALVGRLMGATHAQLVDAFGIALNMMSGSFQSLWDGVDTFKLPGAMGAGNAVLAVQMALRGFKGLKDPLESPQGYLGQYVINPKLENLLADLGKVFYAKGMHKLHPSCYGNHNPIESALALVRSHDFALDDVAEVNLEVPPHRLGIFLNQPVNPTDCQARLLFSIPYAIANVLLRRDVRIEHYTVDNLRDEELLAWTHRVRLVPSEALTSNQESRLVIRLKNGQELSTGRSVPRGWLDDPVSADEVRQKFWRNIEFGASVPSVRAAEALALLDRLETLDDTSALPSLLAA